MSLRVLSLFLGPGFVQRLAYGQVLCGKRRAAASFEWTGTKETRLPHWHHRSDGRLLSIRTQLEGRLTGFDPAPG